MVVEAGYTPDYFRHSTPRDCVKIIRGYKKRQYEKYRLKAFHIYYMAQLIRPKDAKNYHPDRIQPPYEMLGLTPEQRRKLDHYRQMKLAKQHMAKFKEKK